MDGLRPRYTPRAFAAAMPSCWRSRRRLVSNSANTPNMSKKAFPVALWVLLGRSEGDAAFLEQIHNVLEVFNAARQAVHPGDHERIPASEKFEQQRQFGPALTAGGRDFFRTDDLAPRRTERVFLQGAILLGSGNTRVSIERHGCTPVSLAFRVVDKSIS